MAKILLGGNVAQISGSVGGTVYSRNRYGTYERSRVHPTVSTTAEAQGAKAILGTVSAMWAGLSNGQRAAWRQYGTNNPITDRLGMKQALDGHAAFVSVNGKLLCAGAQVILDPVSGVRPMAVLPGTLTATTPPPSLSVTFDDTGVEASQVVVVWGCVVESAGITYVKNLLRMFFTSDTPATSPLDLLTAWNARFGDLVAGQFVHLSLTVLDTLTGLESLPLDIGAEVSTGS
jgi:hypothetical protein